MNINKLLLFLLFDCRDTAGQERFRSVTASYYRGSHVSDCAIAKVVILIS